MFEVTLYLTYYKTKKRWQRELMLQYLAASLAWEAHPYTRLSYFVQLLWEAHTRVCLDYLVSITF